MVWEGPQYPTYYFATGDVHADLVATGTIEHSPSRGTGERYDVRLGSNTAPGAALRYLDSPVEELRDLVRLDWAGMHDWFEEDLPVYVHPRDPYTRIEVLASSRHVRVKLDGITWPNRPDRASCSIPASVRYYLPLTDVRLDQLTPSATRTQCPYKGNADYWGLDLGATTYPDFVWTYRSPLPESQKIAGLVCFWNEKVDLYLDGELQPRPRTHLT